MHAGAYKDEVTTTLYNIGADVCHTKLAAFVKLCGESFQVPLFSAVSVCFATYFWVCIPR